MILESCAPEQKSDEFVIWRTEARHRLKNGSGIRVFSKPDKLKAWLEGEGLTIEDRKHLITDAGQIVPGFTRGADGVEFFCHSPFIRHVDDHDEIRNGAALIFNVRFQVEGNTFDYLAVGDSEAEVLGEIVSTTKAHRNDDRLAWDLYNIPHHCSYLALNVAGEKGAKEIVPTPLVEELLLSGRENAHLVSSSDPIDDTRSAYEQEQPPHVQAKNCYQSYLQRIIDVAMALTPRAPAAPLRRSTTVR